MRLVQEPQEVTAPHPVALNRRIWKTGSDEKQFHVVPAAFLALRLFTRSIYLESMIASQNQR